MTKQQEAYIQAIGAVAKAIRDLHAVPSGHLYARLMEHMSLEVYQGMIARLKQAGLVEEQFHELRWIGPVE